MSNRSTPLTAPAAGLRVKIRQQATKAGASGRGETIEDGSRAIGGPQAIAGLCFLCCAAVVGYDLYLIIAK